MGRLDQQLIDLKAKLQDSQNSRDPLAFESIQKQMKAREKQLLPIYTQMATKFTQLHDASLRMKAKGVIKEVLDWKNCRFFFYKRLNRRVSEWLLIKEVKEAAGDKHSYKSALELV